MLLHCSCLAKTLASCLNIASSVAFACRADPVVDAAVILALHKALAPQGVTLTADANRAWSLQQALQFGRALAAAAGEDGGSSSNDSSSSGSDSGVMDCIDSMIEFNSRMDGSSGSSRMLDHYSSSSGSGGGSSSTHDSSSSGSNSSSSSSVLAYIEEPTADPSDMASFYAETGGRLYAFAFCTCRAAEQQTCICCCEAFMV
jgi:hypothetical protein